VFLKGVLTLTLSPPRGSTGAPDLRTLWSPPVSLKRIYFESNLRIAMCSSLTCPLAGICHNLRIAACTSLSCPPAGIHRTLLFRSSNVPLPGKTVPADTRVLQRGLLFLFVHWLNEGCCVEGGELGEAVRFMWKVTRKHVYEGMLTLTPLSPRRTTGQTDT
jgi:hypothetical protein